MLTPCLLILGCVLMQAGWNDGKRQSPLNPRTWPKFELSFHPPPSFGPTEPTSRSEAMARSRQTCGSNSSSSVSSSSGSEMEGEDHHSTPATSVTGGGGAAAAAANGRAARSGRQSTTTNGTRRRAINVKKVEAAQDGEDSQDQEGSDLSDLPSDGDGQQPATKKSKNGVSLATSSLSA